VYLEKIYDRIVYEIIYCMSESDIFSFYGLKSLCFRLKTAEQEKRKIDVELCAARKQIERQKVLNEERTNAIEHLQERLLLVLSVSHYTQCSVISSYSVICFCLLLSFSWCMDI
jgi:hypothetical protein